MTVALDPDRMMECLAGEWTVRRVVPGQARLEGSAVFMPTDGQHCAYAETGIMTLATGETVTSFQRYVFKAVPGGFDVFFPGEPRRLFHRVALRRVESLLDGSGHHLCGDDTYRTLYRWRSHDAFTVAHRVTGPRKDYAIVTRYTRKLSAAP